MTGKKSKMPFELLLDYLKGKVDAYQLRMAFTEGTQTQDALAAYKNTSFTPEQKQALENELGVPTGVTIESRENLLDLIDNLNKKGYGYGQLADFRYHLKGIYPAKDWTGTLFLTTLLTGIISTFFFLNPKQLDRLEGVLLRVVPLIAPAFLVGFQAYTVFKQAYKTRYEDTYHSDSHRARRWAVGTLPSLLNLSAYVAIAAIGSMSPLAAGLFVFASFIAVLDSIYSFYQINTAAKQETANSASAVRQENRTERTRQAFWIKLYAAVALSATVAISCIFPPTIFVILSCTALFILIPMTKNSWLNKTHTESSQQLLSSLRALEPTSSTETPVLENSAVAINAQPCDEERLTVTPQPSRTGLFKPAMVDFSAASQQQQPNNALEASLVSSRL